MREVVSKNTLRFAVFDAEGPARDWPLINAHLLGPDDQPLRGDVSFENGSIVCRRPGVDAVALALQWDAGPAGVLMLQTCLLPLRRKPYLLSLELARHRIKMYIAKSEEWLMFDLSAEHPAPREWEAARQLLTKAWTSSDDQQADQLARESLARAIDATERLALAHADILLHRRYATRPASSSTLGVRVWPGRDAAPLRELVGKEFDALVLPLDWRELAPKEDAYQWEPVDRWMEWAAKQGKPIIAGPLLNFSRRSVPEWMQVWQHDYDATRDLAYDHLERVVNRYRGRVGMWNIASGLNTGENFTFTPDELLDLVRMSVLLVRQSHRGAKAMIELSQPWSEHSAMVKESIAAVPFIERLVQEGVRLDAVGVQIHVGGAGPGQATRDLMQISALLDRFFLLELPIVISTLGAPSQAAEPAAGYWQAAWSAEQQARWLSRVFSIALSKPFVESIFWNDLFDHDRQELAAGGLINNTGQAKLSLQKLIGLRRILRKPLGALKLPGRAGMPIDDDQTVSTGAARSSDDA